MMHSTVTTRRPVGTRRRLVAVAAFAILGAGLASAGPMIATPKAKVAPVVVAAAAPVTPLSAAPGIRLKRAFGTHDEDCVLVSGNAGERLVCVD